MWNEYYVELRERSVVPRRLIGADHGLRLAAWWFVGRLAHTDHKHNFDRYTERDWGEWAAVSAQDGTSTSHPQARFPVFLFSKRPTGGWPAGKTQDRSEEMGEG